MEETLLETRSHSGLINLNPLFSVNIFTNSPLPLKCVCSYVCMCTHKYKIQMCKCGSNSLPPCWIGTTYVVCDLRQEDSIDAPRRSRPHRSLRLYQSPANLESRSRVTIPAGKSSRTIAYHEVDATRR